MPDQYSFDTGDQRQRFRTEATATAARPAEVAPPTLVAETAPVGYERHLLDYLRVLYKRRWIAITAFSVVFLFVVVQAFTAIPVYEARVRLLIETENQNVVNFQEVVDEAQTRTDYYQTQYSLLQSRSLARRTLDNQKLWDQPPPASEAGRFSVRAAVAGAMTTVTGMFRSAPKPSSSPDTRSRSEAIDRFLGSLAVVPVRNSRIVDITFRSSDPELSARAANAHARNYIEQNLEFKFLATKEATDWLSERLAEQRKKVEESETALQQYRERNDAIPMEDRQNIVVQKLSDLNAAVTRARTDRLEKEALYNQLRSLQSDMGAVDSFPAVLANTFIQEQKSELAALQRQQAQLSEKLGARHPEMIRLASAINSTEVRLQAEIAKVVESVRNQFLSAGAQESSLVSALELQKRDALGMNRKGIEYGVLQRDVESNRQIYDSLLQRAKETGVSGELKTSNIRIIDLAEVPRSPVSPNKRAAVLMGVSGGLVLALGLVFFFDYLDNRVKTPDEIKTHLGLPFLGLIPAVGQSQEQVSPLLNNGVPANFAEAFKAIRTNVLFSTADDGPRSLVVTSTAPGEGKTLVACNLALALAQAGQRVLLADGDLRRPRVHSVFDQAAEPGLSNLIVGTASAKDVVKKTSTPGLWVLTAGRIPPNPAELLGSKRFKEFLLSLSEHFDWIIIDTPPVMVVTDATLVSHVASGVLFVVGAEMISRHGIQVAIEQLAAGSARFFGAVLNRVDLGRHGYYYSAYYRKEYSYHYTETRPS